MALQIGDTATHNPPPARFGGAITPSWWVMRTGPQAMAAAKGHLVTIGARAAWYPTDVRYRKARGRKPTPYLSPLWSGYVFTLFDREPNFREIRDQSQGRITGVVGWGGIPRLITEAEMLDMRMVPDQLLAQRAAIEAAAEEARLAAIPEVGEKARIMAGPFTGVVVDIDDVDGPIAAFLIGGAKSFMDVRHLERIKIAS